MKEQIQYLLNGNFLTQEEAYNMMKSIASGMQNEIQVAAFLTIFNMRVPTIDELKGFRNAMLEMAIPISFIDENILDIVGTGKKKKNTFNISTIASFVCAGAGAKVAKIGNYGFSSVSGSSNVLEYLGVKFAQTQAALSRQMGKSNITFIHAPFYFPAMKNVANVRKQLQVKTIFNILGPIINPCNPNTKVIGVHSEYIGKLYREVLLTTNTEFAIVHAVDGYDEISLTNNTMVFGKKNMKLKSPNDLGFTTLKQTDLLGGDTIASNAKIFMNILNGKGTEAQNNVVFANAALAISLYEQNSYDAALQMARKSLLSGNALSSFKKLVDTQ